MKGATVVLIISIYKLLKVDTHWKPGFIIGAREERDGGVGLKGGHSCVCKRRLT